jgi:hypothetical protein
VKLVYDRERINEGIAAKAYDERNLSMSKSGKTHYPSKLMLIRFLEQFKDIKGTADIWSERDWSEGTEVIHLEIRYKVAKLPTVANEERKTP